MTVQCLYQLDDHRYALFMEYFKSQRLTPCCHCDTCDYYAWRVQVKPKVTHES